MHGLFSRSRRRLLQAGALTLGGLTLAQLLERRAHGKEQARQTSVILLWLEGGPSHMETYDMKPDAPVEYRGEFYPIATRVHGLDVCELLPLHAQVADKFTLIRSIAHEVADHPGAAGRFLTGRLPRNISDAISAFPTFDSITARLRRNRQTGVPHFVSNKQRLKGGGSAYLGPIDEPFIYDGDPNADDFRVQNLAVAGDLAERLEDRVSLRRSLDRWRSDLERSGALDAGDHFQRKALELLTSGRACEAFDLGRESPATRERYGRTNWGQSALLARRLVEAGCSMVTLDWGFLSPAVATWDDHGDAQHIFKSMQARLPIYDQAVSALIEDLHQRGLQRDVLVIATGEFGRTPQVNMGRAAKPVFPGRDHWPGAMSVLVSGGDWRMGQVIGQTNCRGEMPSERALTPNDLLASIYRFLGIDQNAAFLDHRGRPMPILPHGTPIAELG